MKELQELQQLVKDNAPALELLNNIVANVAKLDEQITKQEALKLDAIGGRDAVKQKMRAVADKLGIDISDDTAISSLLNKDKSINNKEISALKNEIEQSRNTAETERASLKDTILNLALEKDIATVLPEFKAKLNAAAYIVDMLKKTAHHEGGTLVFKNEDGTTKRAEGHDATIRDIVKEMRDKEQSNNESMFFNIESQTSGAQTKASGDTMNGFEF